MEKGNWKFYPKKPMRSFRDLEVYAKTLECAVAVASHVRMSIPDFPELTGMVNCALSVPLWIAEAHSLRFPDKKGSIALLERAMAGCNKMVVYLEEAVGIYGHSGADVAPVSNSKPPDGKKSKDVKDKRNVSVEMLSTDLADDLIKKYLDVRGKMFRLEQSWKKFDAQGGV